MKTNFLFLLILLNILVPYSSSRANFLLFYDKFLFHSKNGDEWNDEFNGYSVTERIEIYKKLATPLEEDLITYTWGSSSYIDRMVSDNFSPSYMARLFPTKVGPGKAETLMAGRGIYVSKHMSTSQKYGTAPKYSENIEPGAIGEVVIKKGTLFLDLNRPKTLLKLRKLQKKFGYPNIKSVIFDIISIDPPIVIHYHRLPYYVIKTNDNIEARNFLGTNYELNELIKFYHQMSYPKSRRIAIGEIKRHFDSKISDHTFYTPAKESINKFAKLAHFKPTDNKEMRMKRMRQMENIVLFHDTNPNNLTHLKVVITKPGMIVKEEEIGLISKDSNLDEICEFYGFSKNIANETETMLNLNDQKTFLITQDFNGFQNENSKEVLKKLTCTL